MKHNDNLFDEFNDDKFPLDFKYSTPPSIENQVHWYVKLHTYFLLFLIHHNSENYSMCVVVGLKWRPKHGREGEMGIKKKKIKEKGQKIQKGVPRGGETTVLFWIIKV